MEGYLNAGTDIKVLSSSEPSLLLFCALLLQSPQTSNV